MFINIFNISCSEVLLPCADGFGAEGSAARGIPGSATLEVLLELTGWKSVEDVTGDGGVIKKMLITSSEWKVPLPLPDIWIPRFMYPVS